MPGVGQQLHRERDLKRQEHAIADRIEGKTDRSRRPAARDREIFHESDWLRPAEAQQLPRPVERMTPIKERRADGTADVLDEH